MANETLKQLLTEYEKKRERAIRLAEKKKEDLYQRIPRLAQIDQKISLFTIRTTKTLLQQKDDELQNEYNRNLAILRSEKEKILTQNNIRKDFFQPNFECKECNDTGYIVDKDFHTVMCNCLKQRLFNMEYNKSNIAQLAHQTFENFSLDYYSAEPNFEKYQSDLSPRDNMKLIHNICQEFLQNFDNPEEKNLLFTGSTGLGKTFLSSCLANEALKKGKTVLYQTAPIMLDEIINCRFSKSTDKNDLYQDLLNVDLLIIDDLGTEYMNQMKFTELFNIINTRLLSQKSIKTIISTNLSLQNLYENYDERIVSRLIGYYHICYFFGEDIRFKIH